MLPVVDNVYHIFSNIQDNHKCPLYADVSDPPLLSRMVERGLDVGPLVSQ